MGGGAQNAGGAKEECAEFLALAVPNVMGVVMLLYTLGKAAEAAGPSETLTWVVAAAAIAAYCYSNIGEPEAGTAFEARKLAQQQIKERRVVADAPVCSCAYLGLGRMGSGMAANLAKQGNITLRVWNRNAQVARDTASQVGCAAAESAAAAAEGADFVFACLPTTAVVAQVAEQLPVRPKGAEKALFIDCTSGEPDASKEIAKQLAERGYEYVDAPVSGGPSGADKGTLTIMVGARDAAVFARAKSVLDVIGSTVVHVGPVGAGHAVKAVNNSLNASALLMSAQGLVTLAKLGVAPDVALSVINASSGRNLATQERIPTQVLNRKFDFGFALQLMSKDNNIAASLSQEGGDSADSYADLTARLMKQAVAKYGGDVDFTYCVRLLEDKAGVELRTGAN